MQDGSLPNDRTVLDSVVTATGNDTDNGTVADAERAGIEWYAGCGHV